MKFYATTISSIIFQPSREKRRMGKKLYSINALADELGRDRRTIDRALTGVEPDGMARGHPAWFLTTALAHIEPRGANGEDSDAGQEERARHADEIEWLARECDRALDRLRAEPDLGKRREMAAGGMLHCVGALDRELERSRQLLDPAVAPLMKEHIDRISGRALAEFLHLCQWKLDDAALGEYPEAPPA
jgi:hypothetical protein